MRRAQRAVLRLVLIALAVSGLACATSTQVALDEDASFSSFHTWDWHGRVARLVDGQHGGGPDLDGVLSHLIERSLHERGYQRSRRHPDFFVTYDFELKRRTRIVQVPRAPYLLSSNSSSASYWIEGSDSERQSYRDMRLSVAVIERGGRVVWKGVLRREIADGQNAGLSDAIASVLTRFPRAPDRQAERFVGLGN